MNTRNGLAMVMMASSLFAQPAAPPPPPGTPGIPPAAAPAPKPPAPPDVFVWTEHKSRGQDSSYRSGIRAIDERQYERAVEAFDHVIQQKGSRAEGAMYWKAYSLRRLGKSAEALAVLSQLAAAYPSGRWRADARALEVELRAGGGSSAAMSQEDEELKLLALNGLVQNDPESAVPLIEKILTSPKNPPRLKQRALFVLAQSRYPQAREIVTRMASGASNPDLQLNAIDYLGAIGTAEAKQALLAIYRGSSDAAVRRTALQGLMRARDKAQLHQIARGETDAELKRDAIRALGGANGVEELKELLRSESDRDTRVFLAAVLSDHSKPAALVELARAEKDPAVKKQFVRRLSESRSKEAQAYLIELLQE
jgi:tetratricopeptide (TPR) repeat protein